MEIKYKGSCESTITLQIQRHCTVFYCSVLISVCLIIQNIGNSKSENKNI